MRTSFILVAASVAAILGAAFAFPETVTSERTIDKVVRPVEGVRTVSDVTRTQTGNIVTDVPLPVGTTGDVIDGTFAVLEPTRVPKTVIPTEDIVRQPRVVPVPTETVRDFIGNRFVTVEGKTTDVVEDITSKPRVVPVPTKTVRDFIGNRFITVEGKTTDVVEDITSKPRVIPVPTEIVRDVIGNRFIAVKGKTTDVVEDILSKPRVVPVPTEFVPDVIGNRFITVEGKTTDVVEDIISKPRVVPVPTEFVTDVLGNRFITIKGKTTGVVEDIISEPRVVPVTTEIVRDLVGNKFITVGTEGKATDVVSTGFIKVVEPFTGEKFGTTIDQSAVVPTTPTPVRVLRPITVGRVTEDLNRLTRFLEVEPVTTVPTTTTGVFTDTVTGRSFRRSPFRIVDEVVIPTIKGRD